MKNFKIFWQLLRINLKKSLIYRANFYVTFLSMSLWVALYILFFEVVFSHVDSIAGWDKGEVLTLLGFYYIIQGISNILYREGFERFDYKLRQGELDPILTKPTSTQLLSFFSDMRIDHLLDLFISLIIFIYVAIQTDFIFNFGWFVMGLSLSGIGVILFYSIMLCLINLVFLFERIEVIHSTIWNVSQLSRYPRGIFTKAAGVFVQFIFPAALIVAIPAEFAVGRGEWFWLGLFLGFSLLFFGIGSLLFNLGLRRYSSAN